MVLVVGILLARWPLRNLDPYGPMSEERQAVYSAHGRLQMLARYPGDPINAFEMLDLDPHAAPFSPPANSHWEGGEWYQAVHDKIRQRHMEMLERARAVEKRANGGEEKHVSARGLQYQKAITMSASVLMRDGPRRYYLKTFLPMLEKAIQGKRRECVWPLVQNFHRKECGDTGAISGMTELRKPRNRFSRACA